MARSRKAPQEPTWNEVTSLFESLRHEIGILAEEVRSLRPAVTKLERAVIDLTEEIRLLKTAFRTLDQRVTALEVKTP